LNIFKTKKRFSMQLKSDFTLENVLCNFCCIFVHNIYFINCLIVLVIEINLRIRIRFCVLNKFEGNVCFKKKNEN